MLYNLLCVTWIMPNIMEYAAIWKLQTYIVTLRHIRQAFKCTYGMCSGGNELCNANYRGFSDLRDQKKHSDARERKYGFGHTKTKENEIKFKSILQKNRQPMETHNHILSYFSFCFSPQLVNWHCCTHCRQIDIILCLFYLFFCTSICKGPFMPSGNN